MSKPNISYTEQFENFMRGVLNGEIERGDRLQGELDQLRQAVKHLIDRIEMDPNPDDVGSIALVPFIWKLKQLLTKDEP